ncbi:hypothetical protein EKK58_02285 [Candidatus Dependentiae bacterium]|nr:MAG: hypothetical protein EKK58_02285 [Candidatus Dependentiae bacterium]
MYKKATCILFIFLLHNMGQASVEGPFIYIDFITKHKKYFVGTGALLTGIVALLYYNNRPKPKNPTEVKGQTTSNDQKTPYPDSGNNKNNKNLSDRSSEKSEESDSKIILEKDRVAKIYTSKNEKSEHELGLEALEKYASKNQNA